MRIAVVFLLAAAIGCAAPRRSEDPKIRDEEITRDVQWELHGNERFTEIRVTCKNGVVFLDGFVTTETDRERACSAAGRVSGVQEVQSRLRLRIRPR